MGLTDFGLGLPSVTASPIKCNVVLRLMDRTIHVRECVSKTGSWASAALLVYVHVSPTPENGFTFYGLFCRLLQSVGVVAYTPILLDDGVSSCDCCGLLFVSSGGWLSWLLVC